MMGIPSPEERLLAYPHQLSGGMRQRVAIAIAMLHRPDLIIADEPTTALDVTIQAQILSEVQKLAQQGTSLIWITHDLSVVAGLADEVAVMYAGRIVEHGTVDDVLDRPQHPYTVGLIDSLPSNNRRGQRLRQIPGMTPNLLNLPLAAPSPRAARASAACIRTPLISEALPTACAAFTPPSRSGRWRHERHRTPHEARRDATAKPARDARDATATQGDATPLIELRNVSKRFGERPWRRRPPAATRRPVQAARRDPRRGRRGPDRAPRRSGRPGRRIRLRQVHAGPRRGRPAHAVRRRGPHQRPAPRRHDAGPGAPGPPESPDDLPGSLRQPQPAPARGRDRGRGRASTAWSAGASSTTTSAPSCSAPAWIRPCASAIRTNSAAASASASASPARWRCSRPCWSATRPWPRWTYRSRRRS